MDQPKPMLRAAALRVFPTVLALVFLVSLVSLVALAQALPAVSSEDYVIIVNPQSPAQASLDRAFITAALLKKVTRWDDDLAIQPVDQGADAAVRRKFSEDVLKRSIAAVRSYWQQLIFAGRDVPPPELDSDAAVVAFVAKHRGAIGYVSGATDTRKVRTVKLR